MHRQFNVMIFIIQVMYLVECIIWMQSIPLCSSAIFVPTRLVIIHHATNIDVNSSPLLYFHLFFCQCPCQQAWMRSFISIKAQVGSLTVWLTHTSVGLLKLHDENPYTLEGECEMQLIITGRKLANVLIKQRWNHTEYFLLGITFLLTGSTFMLSKRKPYLQELFSLSCSEIWAKLEKYWGAAEGPFASGALHWRKGVLVCNIGHPACMLWVGGSEHSFSTARWVSVQKRIYERLRLKPRRNESETKSAITWRKTNKRNWKTLMVKHGVWKNLTRK